MTPGFPTQMSEEELDEKIQKIKNADQSRKVDVIQFFGIQLENLTSLPPASLPAITLLLPPLLRSSHHLLPHSILSSLLPYYLPLLPLSPAEHVRLAVAQLTPAILERVAEAKERVHAPAEGCVITLGALAYASDAANGPAGALGASVAGRGKEKSQETASQIFERLILDTLTAKSPRLKLGALKILLGVRDKATTLPLRPFLPVLVEVLQDGDGAVRDAARDAIIKLLAPPQVPAAARSELRKLFAARGIKQALADGIFLKILEGPVVVVAGEGVADGEVAAGAVGGEEEVPVVFIATEKDILRDFALLRPVFEGKESEDNWAKRDKAVTHVRGMIKGGAGGKWGPVLVDCLRGFLAEQGAPKALMSLRTTLATNTICLYVELSEALGKLLDPLFELLITPLGKMAGMTKKLVAAKAQAALTSAIIHTSCPVRVFLPFLYSGLGDKIPQTRTFFAGHMKTWLEHHAADARSGMGRDGEAAVTAALKKALGDSSPGVKEVARGAYWSYERVWPTEAAVLLGELDTMGKKGVEKARPSGSVISSVGGAAPVEKKRTTMSAMEAIRKARMQQARGRVVSADQAVGGEVKEKEAGRRMSEQPRHLAGSTSRAGGMTPEREEEVETVVAKEVKRVVEKDLPEPEEPAVDVKELPELPAKIEEVESETKKGAFLAIPEPPTVVDLTSPRASPTKDVLPSPQLTPPRTVPPAASPVRALPTSPIRQRTPPNLPSSPPRTNGRKAPPRIPIASPPRSRSSRSQSLPDSPPPEYLIDSLGSVDCSFWLDRQPLETRHVSLDEQQRLGGLLKSNAVTLKELEDLASVLANKAANESSAANEQAILELIRKSKDSHGVEEMLSEERGGVEVLLRMLLDWISPSRAPELLEQSVLVLWQMAIFFHSIVTQNEGDILTALLSLRRCTDSEIRRGSAALGGLLAECTPDPVYQLNAVVSMFQRAETPVETKSQERNGVFVLVQLARLMLRLPAVVAEEETRRLQDIIMTAMNSSSIASREAATTLILAIQSRIRDESLLFSLLPTLTTAQKNLLVYMFSQKQLEGSKPEGGAEKGLGKEMRRLSSKM